MYQIIAPTLFQNKICRLPGIGTLLMVNHPAQTDFANSLIQPPTETINFLPEDNTEKLFNEFSAISELLKKNLEENGNYPLKGIGTFTKEATGEIKFAPVSLAPVFNPSIPAERAIRQDAAHAIMVGDQQTTNVEMVEYFNAQPTVPDRWWVWAIILATLGIAALLIYFYQNGVNQFANRF